MRLATALQDMLAAFLDSFDTTMEADRWLLEDCCEPERVQRAIAGRLEYKLVVLGCCEVLARYARWLGNKV